jgi:hypothetical protein
LIFFGIAGDGIVGFFCVVEEIGFVFVFVLL